MSIDPTQPIPLYYQLKTLLLEEILSGRYGSDDRLPTEHELCRQYAISRTPVTRALSELAEEGVILRHRRRGTFVNPHWLRRRPDQPEVRVVVSEGPWGDLIRDAAPEEIQVNLITVPLRSLRQVLTHAVAEGQAPDLAILDSVWIAEFAADGFLLPLADLDADWLRQGARRRLPRAARGGEPLRRPHVRRLAVRERRGVLVPQAHARVARRSAAANVAELRAVGRAAARNGSRHPIVMTGGSKGGETTAYCLIAFLESNGAHVLSPEGVTLDSRATAQALRFLRSLIDEGLMSPAVLGYEWTKPVAAARRGKGGDQLRRQLRDENARGDARRAARGRCGITSASCPSPPGRPAPRRPSPAR